MIKPILRVFVMLRKSHRSCRDPRCDRQQSNRIRRLNFGQPFFKRHTEVNATMTLQPSHLETGDGGNAYFVRLLDQGDLSGVSFPAIWLVHQCQMWVSSTIIRQYPNRPKARRSSHRRAPIFPERLRAANDVAPRRSARDDRRDCHLAPGKWPPPCDAANRQALEKGRPCPK